MNWTNKVNTPCFDWKGPNWGGVKASLQVHSVATSLGKSLRLHTWMKTRGQVAACEGLLLIHCCFGEAPPPNERNKIFYLYYLPNFSGLVSFQFSVSLYCILLSFRVSLVYSALLSRYDSVLLPARVIYSCNLTKTKMDSGQTQTSEILAKISAPNVNLATVARLWNPGWYHFQYFHELQMNFIMKLAVSLRAALLSFKVERSTK